MFCLKDFMNLTFVILSLPHTAGRQFRQYCQENSDIPDNNPAGWQNLLAYFTAAVAMEAQQVSVPPSVRVRR